MKTFKRQYIQQAMICAGDKDGKKSTLPGSGVWGFKPGMRLGLDSQAGSQVGD